jgi:SAM-dependent methyltransferase
MRVLSRVCRPLWRALAPAVSRLTLRACRRRKPLSLHLGCGGNILPGWINADIVPEADVYVDARKRLPFADGSLHAVYAEEMIEHLSLEDGTRLLGECARCLAPGGRIRLTTPDLAFLLSFASMTPDHEEALRLRGRTCREQRFARPESLVAEYVNDAFFLHGHRFLYDSRTLVACLESAGFSDARRVRPGQSMWAEFRGLDTHLCRYPAPESSMLIVEACRPGGAAGGSRAGGPG